jgi:membrane protease YdiL (CAAX protease family)
VVPLLALPVLVVGVLLEGGDQDFLDAFLQAGTLQQLTPSGLLYLNLALGGLVLWTWALIRVLHQMRPRWLSSVVPKLRWRFLAICLGLALVALLAQLVVDTLVPTDANPDVAPGPNPVTGTTVALLLIMVFTTPLQAAGEEYAFRGYLTQAVGRLVDPVWPSRVVAVVVPAVLFALAHGLGQDWPIFVDRLSFGLLAGCLVILTGGLEAGIAMHVLNNFLAFGLAIAFGDMTSALTPTGGSWWALPVTLTQSLSFLVLTVLVARAGRLQKRTEPPELVAPEARV